MVEAFKLGGLFTNRTQWRYDEMRAEHFQDITTALPVNIHRKPHSLLKCGGNELRFLANTNMLILE